MGAERAWARSGCLGPARGDFCAFPLEDAPGQVVQPMLDTVDVLAGQFVDVAALGDKAADEANDLFDRAALPGAVWVAVVGACADILCDAGSLQ